MSRPNNWQEVARETQAVEFACHAPEAYFPPSAIVPAEVWAEIDENGPIPCEGGGVVGFWCWRCRFGEYRDE